MTEEKNYSEQTVQQIDREVLEMFGRLCARVKKILNQRCADLDRMASELIKKEPLEHDELMNLLADMVQANGREIGDLVRAR